MSLAGNSEVMLSTSVVKPHRVKSITKGSKSLGVYSIHFVGNICVAGNLALEQTKLGLD